MESIPQTTGKESRLRTRLAARYQTVLSKFHDNVRDYNAQLDHEQTERLEALKDFLQKSHAECEESLCTEDRRVELHKGYLDKYETTINSTNNNNINGTMNGGSAATGGTYHTLDGNLNTGLPLLEDGGRTDGEETLEPFTDYYHKTEVNFDDSKSRLRSERQRLLGLCTAMTSSHKVRLSRINEYEEETDAEEAARREWIRRTLEILVESLTKIGYTSISASHVMAQRAIHSINDHLCRSYVARKTLMTQLRCREILRQRQYSRRLADMYGASLELMLRSSVRWAITLLRTAHFRQPRCRAEVLERVGTLILTIRREGTQFIENISTTVRSLRRAREPLPSECGQMCGGTLPDGWLRGFDGGIFSPVFATSPSEVTVEWRVKANVLVRNALAQCVTLSNEVCAMEQRLCAEATAIGTELQYIISWVCTPIEGEPKVWTAVSSQGNEDDEGSIDDVYQRFTIENSKFLSLASSTATKDTAPLLASIKSESDWFASNVRAKLCGQHAALEGLLLRDEGNVLLSFQWVTESLEVATTGTFGLARSQLVAIHNARRDHEDTLRRFESELQQLLTVLQRAVRADAAQDLFREGLEILGRISTQHADFHRHTVESLWRVSREGPMAAVTQSAILLRCLGLESRADCERRLEQERIEREREEAAAREVAGRRGGRAAREVPVEVETESESEESGPDYPSLTASDGSLYYIIGPIQSVQEDTSPLRQQSAPVEVPTSGKRTPPKHRSLSPSRQRGLRRATRGKSPTVPTTPSHSTMPSTPTPTGAFMRRYDVLLRQIIGSDEVGTEHSLGEWCGVLRLEVVNWSIQLYNGCRTHLEKYALDAKAAVDAETNEILRHHRRRSATVQADYYESRLREIENTRATEDKYFTRLRERAARLEASWECAIASSESTESSDIKLFDQLQALERMAAEANSVSGLQSQENTFNTLVTQSLSDHARRCQQLLDDITRQHEALDAECRSFLRSCGKTVPDDLSNLDESWSGEDDENGGFRQAFESLHRLKEAARSAQDRLRASQEEHEERIEAARNSYAVVYEQNVEELQMLAKLKEVFSRLKVQVHSLIVLSEASEFKLDELVKELEQRLSEPAQMYDFTGSLQETSQRYVTSVGIGGVESDKKNKIPNNKGILLKTDGNPSKSVAPNTTSTADRAAAAEAELTERLVGLRADMQRQIRASDASKVLRLIDELRGGLYVRGRQLNCLQFGIENYKIPPENYVEPRLSPQQKEEEVVPVAPASRRPKSKSGIGAVTASPGSSSIAALYDAAELPEVEPVDTQVTEWVTSVRDQATSIIDSHFAMVPSPLQRQLPGMSEGTPEEVAAHVAHVCENQQNRITEHMDSATRRYREIVERVQKALQRVPTYLTNATYSLSAITLERRVETVLSVFSNFYGESETLRGTHDRLVKVTLASSHNRDRVAALCEAEGARHNATQSAIERFWGFALREMEEEATMHAARCLNVTHNLLALTRGLVGMEHLRPFEDDNNSGHHRGLRRLIRLRENEERARELQQLAAPQRRERRLQETMPRHRHSLSPTGERGKRRDSRDFSVEIAANAAGLPLLPSREVEHAQVPLCAFQPLTEFNAKHPTAAVSTCTSSTAPVFVRSILQKQQQQQHQTTGGRRRKESVAQAPLEAEESPQANKVTVVPIVAPATLMHRETAALTHHSVELFNNASTTAATRANAVFGDWAQRETSWQQTWIASIKRLED